MSAFMDDLMELQHEYLEADGSLEVLILHNVELQASKVQVLCLKVTIRFTLEVNVIKMKIHHGQREPEERHCMSSYQRQTRYVALSSSIVTWSCFGSPARS